MVVSEPSNNSPISLSQFLKYGLGVGGIPLRAISFLVNSYILLYACIALFSSYSYFTFRKEKMGEWQFIYLLTINGLLSFLLIPKGLYKYYLSSLMPLFIVSVWYSLDRLELPNMQRCILAILILVFNLIIILIPRIYTPATLILMLSVIIILYRKCRNISTKSMTNR